MEKAYEINSGNELSMKEAINRFVEICRGNNARNSGNEIVGLKTVQVLSAMYKSVESGEVEIC